MGQPDLHGVDAAGEVRAGGRRDEQEGVRRRRVHAEGLLGGDEHGPQVERLFAAGLGHPRLVDVDEEAHGLEEEFLGQLGHGHAGGGALEAAGVLLGAEGDDRPVGVAVGLEALEDRLAVMQHRRGGVHGQRAVRLDARGMPATVGVPVDADHVVGEVLAESGLGQDAGALLVGAGVLVADDVESRGCHGVHRRPAVAARWPRPGEGSGSGGTVGAIHRAGAFALRRPRPPDPLDPIEGAFA